MSDDQSAVNATELATELTIAWLGNPNTRVDADSVPEFLNRMHRALCDLRSPTVLRRAIEEPPEYVGAVSVRASLASPDHIVSMIDGRPYRSLRRHLATNGLTPVEYRRRYGLKPDYPMVAPAYSEARRALAKSIGLGRRTEVRQVDEPRSAAEPSSAAPSRPAGEAQPAEKSQSTRRTMLNPRFKAAEPTDV